ncbi:MAG: thioredoxin-disulfide reductase [Nitrospinae bacterium]|nr:thioredoxin-disulfide reductase [Nitrospinota bacterium]
MYDLVIIGGGPAGLTAAIYALRARLNTLVIEKLGVGGQIALSDIIENYPGFPSLSGGDLMKHFEDHARAVGMQTKFTEVLGIDQNGPYKTVRTADGPLETKAVIIATGAEPKRLGFPGEQEFLGKGISTCGTCDGPFYRNKPIAVIGGGDTAVKESIYLSRLASKVYHIHRRDRFRAEKILQERLLARENVEILWRSSVEAALGDDSGVTGIRVKNADSGEARDIKVDGIFVFIGITPSTGFVECDKDPQGFIITGADMTTSNPGIFAAGDCRDTPLRQVSTAVGDGAIAAAKAEEYISEMEGRAYPSAPK